MSATAFRNGFLILDKPVGISSAQAVAQVKRLFKPKKIGHGGTLDPLASGVLPLALGEATKAFDYVAASEKHYAFTVMFGESRATDDAEGAVLNRTERLPTEGELAEALPHFLGTVSQVPPIYSALKINGARAYALARAGEVPAMQARPVVIYGLTLLAWHETHADFEVRCGKGTYIRSLARDIAIKCNSLGYVSSLRRRSVGKFTENQSISLEKLADSVHSAAHLTAWVPIELALDDIPAINLDSEQSQKLRHGQTLSLHYSEGTYRALHRQTLVALVQSANGLVRSMRVFNTD